jgi:hypothetical protein
MDTLAIGGEEVGRGWRIAAAERAVVTNIDPDPPLLDRPPGSLGGHDHLGIEHPDRRVIGMQPRARKDVPPDQGGQRLEGGNALTAPVDQGRAGNVRAQARQDLALTVQRQMIVELADQDMREQARTRHAAPHRPGWSRRLHHRLALAARLLEPRRLDQLELGLDEVEDLGHVLANQPQRAAAVGTTAAGIEYDPLADHVAGQAGLAAPARDRTLRGGGRLVVRLFEARVGRGPFDLEPFQSEFELLDLAGDLLGRGTKLLLLEPGDLNPERLDQGLKGSRRGGQLVDLGLLCGDDRA